MRVRSFVAMTLALVSAAPIALAQPAEPEPLQPPPAPMQPAPAPMQPAPAPMQPAPAAQQDPQPAPRYRSRQEEQEFQAWKRDREEARREEEEARQEEEEERRQFFAERDAKDANIADRLKLRGLMLFGVGGFGRNQMNEGHLRFELGGGVQHFFTSFAGYQATVNLGLGAVSRKRISEDEQLFLTEFGDFSLEAAFLFGTFGRFYAGAGPWLSIGGYFKDEVTTDLGTQHFFARGALVHAGPNFVVGLFVGSTRHVVLSAKIQPGVEASIGEFVLRGGADIGFVFP